jgi:hypothetical protein
MAQKCRFSQGGIGIKPAYCFTDAVTDDIDYFRVVSERLRHAPIRATPRCAAPRYAMPRLHAHNCFI